MTTPLKLTAFAAVLALAFGGASALGGAIGPEPAADEPAAGHGGGHAPAADDTDDAHAVRGLAVAEGGLRLVLRTPELRRGADEELRYEIVDEDGAVVRDFDLAHERRMHLILARRDLTGFQHLHPEQDSDGAWSVRARIEQGGSYRLFADFTRDGEPFTLASDLRVDGPADLRDLPGVSAVASAGDGYEVRRAPGELRFTVHKDGAPVHVEPYLGAGGHLVALREGDLAFLHVHPTGHAAGHDDAVAFEATFPTTGRYRLFLQFKHDGRVRTAAFTEEVR